MPQPIDEGAIIPGNDGLGTIVGGMAADYVIGRIVGALVSGAGEEGGVVLGRTSELGEGALGPGERTLNLPDLGDPKANWAQNYRRLREAMAEGKPVRDAHVDAAGNRIVYDRAAGQGDAFHNAERNVLEITGGLIILRQPRGIRRTNRRL